MKPVKLGIIGCGIAAKELHWPALKELKDKFEITVVCNHTEEKAEEFSKLIGNVPYVLNYREVLEMPEVEAVDIILPIELNYQAVKDAAKAGKHIMVEKPLAANLVEAEALVALERTYPQVTMVAENFRYRTIFQQVRLFLDQGKIGKPYAVFWNNFNQLDGNNKFAQTKWRIDHKYPGGFVTDGGVHNIAALRDLFGDISGIGAFAKSVNLDIGRTDSLSFQFSTRNHLSGVFNIFFSVNGFTENRLIILGKDGSIIVEDNILTVKRNEQIEIIEKFENDNGYREEFEDFYQAIRTDHPVKSSFIEAYKDLKVILDALSSARK